MRKSFFSRSIIAGFAIAAVLLSAACATRSDAHSIQPFGAVGTEADVYVFASVAGNEPLLKTVFMAFVPETTAEQYLKRTEALYIGAEYGGSTPEVTMVSAGSYPVALSGLLFSKKDGWEKRRSTSYGKETYYHSSAADIVLRSKNAFALLGSGTRNTEGFLQRVSEPRQPVFPVRFQTLVDAGGEGEIGVYAPSGSRVAAALFGLQDIALPVRSIALYLKKNTDASYRYSAVFEAVNTRAALVLRALLGAVLKGTLSVQDASIFVENADISEAELISLFRSFIS